MAHSALALGLVAVSLLPGQRVDLSSYLFGEILAVTRFDLGVIWGGAVAVALLLAWRWSALLAATLNPDLAQAAGGTAARAVDPDAGAGNHGGRGDQSGWRAADRGDADHPRRQCPPLCPYTGNHGFLGHGSGRGGGPWGLLASLKFDTPTGPSIVSIAAGLFALSSAFSAALPALRRRGDPDGGLA